MVIEVVGWEGAKKTHAVNQALPHYTLCGRWIPQYVVKHEGQEAFPTCLRCELSVMKS